MFQTQKKSAAKWIHWIKCAPATIACPLHYNLIEVDVASLSRERDIKSQLKSQIESWIKGCVASAATLFLLASCASAPAVRPANVNQGQWTTKILVRDKLKNKSATLSVDATSVWPARLRLDATATLGVSVLTLALDNDQLTYVLPRQKKYYVGPVSDHAFAHVMSGVLIDPRWMIALLFDRPIQGPGWKCVSPDRLSGAPGADRAQISECDNDTSQMKVQVTQRAGERRLIAITSPRAEVKIQIQDFTGDIHPDDAMFTLVRPADFVEISNK